MKKIITIGAFLIGIGTVIYYFYTKTEKKETQYSNPEKNESIKKEMSNVIVTAEDTEKEMKNLSSVKQEASSMIKEKHEEAAQIIRESLEHIYEESPEASMNEKSEADDINAQLDDLLE